MTAFLISQILGLLIFAVVSFSIYCYLNYKRNKAFQITRRRRPLWYTLSLALLSVLFAGGISYRLAILSDGLREGNELEFVTPQQREEIEITSTESPI